MPSDVAACAARTTRAALHRTRRVSTRLFAIQDSIGHDDSADAADLQPIIEIPWEMRPQIVFCLQTRSECIDVR